MITIDVQMQTDESAPRQVTRISGSAGIAITIQTIDLERFTVDPENAVQVMLAQPEMPSVCIRADNAMELALMLAGVIATAVEAHPEVLPIALALSRLMDAGHPLMKKEYPR